MSINYVSRSAVSYLDYVKIFEVKTVKSPKLLWRLNPLWAFWRNFQTMSSWYFKAWFVSYVRHWAHNKFYVRLGEDRHDEKGLSANLTLFVRTRNVEYNISWNDVRNGLSHFCSHWVKKKYSYSKKRTSLLKCICSLLH